MRVVTLSHPGWWARNGAELQALTTIALIVVTAVYVALTRGILRAQRRSTDASEIQSAAAQEQVVTARKELEHMQAALAVDQATVKAAQNHAERVFLEAVRSRLSAASPTVMATVAVNTFGLQSGMGAGTMTLDAFARETFFLSLDCRFFNEGPGPAIAEINPAPANNPFEAEAGQVVVRANSDTTTHLKLIAQGSNLLKLQQYGMPPLHFTTSSPLTRVADHHTWIGTISFPVEGDHVLCNQGPKLMGPPFAEQIRHFPDQSD